MTCDLYGAKSRNYSGESFVAARTPRGRVWLQNHPRWDDWWACVWTRDLDRVKAEALAAGLTFGDQHPAHVEFDETAA